MHFVICLSFILMCYATDNGVPFDAISVEANFPDWLSTMTLDQAPQSIQKMMQQNPNGLNPDVTYTADSLVDGKVPSSGLVLKSDISSIDFYATGGCHGGPGNGAINIVAKDFAGPKLCPTGASGDGNNDDLEDNGASFHIYNRLGNCQLHWYKAPGCNDADWLGFTGGSEQSDKCNVPHGADGNTITGIRAFNYICPDD